MPAKSNDRVPETEMELLAYVQRAGSATAAEVRAGVAAYRPLAHSSVVTLLNRLEGRGLLVKEKGEHGKAFVYRPTRKRASTVKPMLKRLVNRVYAGDSVALVASLFETKPPTAREIEELERMVAELKRSEGRK